MFAMETVEVLGDGCGLHDEVLVGMMDGVSGCGWNMFALKFYYSS